MHSPVLIVLKKTTVVNNELILLIQTPRLLGLPSLLTDHGLGNKSVPGAQ